MSPKQVLLTGSMHSGTSLLASALGRHPDINMLLESMKGDRTIGKDYEGNKLLTYRQIRWNQRASMWGSLINKAVNIFHKGRYKYTPYPMGDRSYSDYVEMNAKIIVLCRDHKGLSASLMKRRGFTKQQADQYIDKVMREIDRIPNKLTIFYSDLVSRPEDVYSWICDFLDIKYSDRMMQAAEYNYIYPL